MSGNGDVSIVNKFQYLLVCDSIGGSSGGFRDQASKLLSLCYNNYKEDHNSNSQQEKQINASKGAAINYRQIFNKLIQ